MDFSTLSGSGNNRPSLNLSKGATLDLTKEAPNLHRAILGGGWDVAVAGVNADLDISAMLLDRNKKIRTINDVIYYRNMSANGIRLEGDNRTGEGEGDDERIDIDLDKIDADIHHIVFFMSIFEADKNRQTFGMIRNAFVRLLDADNNEKELCHYNLTGDYQTSTIIKVCALHRTNNGWTFEAKGEGAIGDLNTALSPYA